LEDFLIDPIESVFQHYSTSSNGLTSNEAAKRLTRFGPNLLSNPDPRSKIVNFLSLLRSPITIILLFAAVISIFFYDVDTAVIILILVFLSIALEYFQEARSRRHADMLQRKVTTTAVVLRDGAPKTIPVREIVPGDILLYRAGDFVPVDTRLLEANDVFTDQADVTGESIPVAKNVITPTEAQLLVMDYPNCLFMGSSIVSGTGKGIALKTGAHAHYARLKSHLDTKEELTDFEKGARRFRYIVLEATLILVMLVFFFLSFRFEILNPNAVIAEWGKNILLFFLFSLALAAGLTPDMLSSINYMNLIHGALNMAKHGLIVKHLKSIQDLGTMDVVCLDKTGTLTQNRIEGLRYLDIEGYEEEKVFQYSYLNSYFHSGLKTLDDMAILQHETVETSIYQKIAEIPFDFTRKRITTVVRKGDKQYLIVKGAPEDIIRLCYACEFGACSYELAGERLDTIHANYERYSGDGYRVLAVAYKEIPPENRAYSVSDEVDLTMLGFVIYQDPPLEASKVAIEKLTKAGVKVKIITGDNEIFTRHVMESLEIPIEGIVIGPDLVQASDDALARTVERVNIFARVTPGQKSRILNVLRSNGHVVGFLGDGITDASTVRNSDIGISTDNAAGAAKESADIVLMKKDLDVLYEGVLEARRTFHNTLKYLLLRSSSNLGNMFTLAAMVVFLPFLPMLPRMILLMNLLANVMDSFLPSDNVDDQVLMAPRRLNVDYIRRFMFVMGPISSLGDLVTLVVVVFLILGGIPAHGFTAGQQGIIQTALFTEMLLSEILVIYVLRTPRSPFRQNKPSLTLMLSTILISAFGIMLPYIPFGMSLFAFVPLPTIYYLYLAVILIGYLVLFYYLRRWLFRRNAPLIEAEHGGPAPVELPFIGTR
jgi:Mg2+-importing ATPase